MKKYKIYCLKNPDTNEIRYIGVTSAPNISSRLSQHWYNANNGNQTRVAKWIRSIKKRPIIEVIEECTEDTWENREKYWIKFYDNLTNIHEGGKGVVVDRTLTSIERSSKAHEIKIVQLDDEGNLIKIWNSLKEAIIFFNGKSESSISNVLNNNYGAKRAFGYQWFYYSDFINNNYKIRENNSNVNYDKIKKVYLYDINDNFIRTYLSLNILKNDLNCAYTSAKKALKNNKLLYKKYKIRNYKI